MTIIDKLKLKKTPKRATPKAARRSKKTETLQDKARDHLWMHFTRQGPLSGGAEVPVIVKGNGHHIWDDNGKRYIDGLAGLFVVNAGHGRARLAEVAKKQAEELAFFPLWSYAHPAAIELADKLADYAPGDLNKVFFTTGGGEGGGECLQARQTVLEAQRPADETQSDFSLRRLPRNPPGGPGHHRNPGDEGNV